MKRVSIIIPHFNGIDILDACLKSLGNCSYQDFEIIVVDNASTDASVKHLKDHYPHVSVVENETNQGFAGGCNRGMEVARGEYLLILNNDTTHESDWIEPLVQALDSNPGAAAVQPKLRSAQHPECFDYAGGAGGEMDMLGYPFALGRIFTSLEEDRGQYDEAREIFWASGTALMLRRSALDEVGFFDEEFFAHMEEIDLCWRLQNAGWTILNAPTSRIMHHSGWTLPPDKYLKKYLNHRNNLIMMVKNYPFAYLAFALPARIALEGVAIVFSLLIGDFKRIIAILHALGWNLLHPFLLLRKHMEVKATRKPGAIRETMSRMYPGSIFFQYFLLGRRKASEIKWS